jgi:hypothetical protein
VERAVAEVENVYLPFPAGNQYARKTPCEGVFLSRLEGITANLLGPARDTETAETGLTLPGDNPCASIGTLRRADQGFVLFSFAPHSGTQVGAALSFIPTIRQALARACSFFRRTSTR